MVLREVLIEKVDVLAETTFVLFFAFLVCFLVSFPVVLLAEAFFACSTPVPGLFLRMSASLRS